MSSETPRIGLTDLQRRVLFAMSTMRAGGGTPNKIGAQVGAKTVQGGRGTGGRGSGHRTFGAAQQIIPTLTSLRKRGLIYVTTREDGLSGTAYYLTDEGMEAVDQVIDDALDVVDDAIEIMNKRRTR